MALGGVNIRQDIRGRYFLNDLHKAAGGKESDRPSFFLRNTNTRALITELKQCANSTSDPVAVINGGHERGTFVCRELVYAYAMWISAPFFLKVIRAYGQLATKGIAMHEDKAVWL